MGAERRDRAHRLWLDGSCCSRQDRQIRMVDRETGLLTRISSGAGRGNNTRSQRSTSAARTERMTIAPPRSGGYFRAFASARPGG